MTADILADARDAIRHGVMSPFAMNSFTAVTDAYERLHSWDGLIELLDEFYPADIWTTGHDEPSLDPGHRVVRAIRRVDALRAVEAWIEGRIAEIEETK